MREGEERCPARKTNSGAGDCACMKTKGKEREGQGGREGGEEERRRRSQKIILPVDVTPITGFAESCNKQ